MKYDLRKLISPLSSRLRKEKARLTWNFYEIKVSADDIKLDLLPNLLFKTRDNDKDVLFCFDSCISSRKLVL